MSDLTREQIKDILNEIGVTKIIDKAGKENLQVNCPIHGENTPSMGVHTETLQVHCFACHFSGSLQWLVYKAVDDFKSTFEVERWIESRYGVNLDSKSHDRQALKNLRRFEDRYKDSEVDNKRHELKRTFLAPFKSGKETYGYFTRRGFTKKTMQDFMIGRDLESKTVTIPVYWEDKVLCGVVGRYIDPNRPKNSRYKLYEFPKSTITYPQDKLQVIDDTIIIVEGILDALWLHQEGFPNAQAILGNEISKDQVKYLKSKANNFIIMTDNDSGGEQAIKRIKDYMGRDVKLFSVEYPSGKKDAQECTKEEIQHMLDNKTHMFGVKLKRI